MPFKLVSATEFVALPMDKRRYYLARLYIKQDAKENKMPYRQRLFSVIKYLEKQDDNLLSVLYSYLSAHTHDGLMIWEIVPRAILYDQQQRRQTVTKSTEKYEEFNESMLDDILGG